MMKSMEKRVSYSVRFFSIWLLIILPLQLVAAADAQQNRRVSDEVTRGTLQLHPVSGGGAIEAPQLKTDVKIEVTGMLARVSVRQAFKNPGGDWVEGVYKFPLPEDSAVDRLRMEIGERVIEGEIQEREQARKTYQKARLEGRKATLLSQERPNIFTTAVANIGPDETVVVEIEYQQTLRYDQGQFSIRFPMVVAPRYIPGVPVGGEQVIGFDGTGWARNTDQVPDASQITPPVVSRGEHGINPVDIQVALNVGLPLSHLESAYHPIDSQRVESGRYQVRLKSGPVPADRDFELVWQPEPGRAPGAALFAEQWGGDTYALLMVMPPLKALSSEPEISREAVFVIDVSGSMHGESIVQAQSALRLALSRLRIGDRFNLIAFNDQPHPLFDQPQTMNARTLRMAQRFVNGLEAEGGTEMLPALQLALTGQGDASGLRQIIFLTDGSVGNEEALFGAIHQGLGQSRLFTIGIGSAPNSHFMTRAAEFGRGSFTYIGDANEVKEKMARLFSKLESPVLTNIQLDWPEDMAIVQWPQRIPDLYLGEPVSVAVKLSQLPSSITIRGHVSDRPWQQQIQLGEQMTGSQSAGVHTLWARRKIAELMAQKDRGRSEDKVRQEVLSTALEHQLVSRYSSLVAVDKTPVRPAEESLEKQAMPANLPKGWTGNKVFGRLPQTATWGPLQLISGSLFLSLAALLWLPVARRAVHWK